MNAPSKPKPADASADARAPRPRSADLRVEAAHKRIAKRFPKVLAKLGE